MGPSTDPWETPLGTGLNVEWSSPTLTMNSRSVRGLLIQNTAKTLEFQNVRVYVADEAWVLDRRPLQSLNI